MRILIKKEVSEKGAIFVVYIESTNLNGIARAIEINDEAHSNLGEVEAKARAAAIRAVTGWEVVKEYEND